VLNRYDYSDQDPQSRERAIARTLKTILERIEPPAQRLEHQLQPWTTYLVLPIFALANAGVNLSGSFSDLLQPVSLGVFLGLVIGKPVGITLFAWLGTRLGLAELPRGVRWGQFFSASVLAGIGFTVSLFITSAAYPTPELASSAKLGILAGSVVAAVFGYLLLTVTSPHFDTMTGAEPERAGAAAV
jgi:NhaA family Na+:H+ antiporter